MLHVLHEALQVLDNKLRLLLRHAHSAQDLGEATVQAEQVDGAADQRRHGLVQFGAGRKQPPLLRRVQQVLCRLVQRLGLTQISQG